MRVKSLLALIAVVFSLIACSNHDEDMSQTTNSLVKTVWSFEKTDNRSFIKHERHWGKLEFISTTEVLVTSGYKLRAESENGSGSNNSKRENETTVTATYTYAAPLLRITLPQSNTSPLLIELKVDESAGTITQVKLGDEVVDGDQAVGYYKK